MSDPGGAVSPGSFLFLKEKNMDELMQLELRRIANNLDNIESQLQILNLNIDRVIGDCPGCDENNIHRIMDLVDKVSSSLDV